MTYLLLILPRAQREMKTLTARDREKIKKAILALSDNPRPMKCQKLTGREGWRIRIGDYRVIYEIDDSNANVTIMQVGHRREIYR